MAWKPHHDKIMPFWINNIYRSSADIQQIHTKLYTQTLTTVSHTQRQLEIDSYANAYFSTHFISCISSISMAFSAICNRYIHYNILRSIVTSFYTLFFLLRSTISFLIFFFLKYLDNTFFFLHFYLCIYSILDLFKRHLFHFNLANLETMHWLSFSTWSTSILHRIQMRLEHVNVWIQIEKLIEDRKIDCNENERI